MGRGLITHSYKKKLLTATRSYASLANQGKPAAVSHGKSDSMTPEGQSRQETLRLSRPLVDSKNVLKIGNWNARTLYRSGNLAQIAREMTKRDIDIIGISETHRMFSKTNAYERY